MVSVFNINRLSSLAIFCYMPLSINTNVSMMVYTWGRHFRKYINYIQEQNIT